MSTVTGVRLCDSDCRPWGMFGFIAKFTSLCVSDDIGCCHRFIVFLPKKAAPLAVLFSGWFYMVWCGYLCYIFCVDFMILSYLCRLYFQSSSLYEACVLYLCVIFFLLSYPPWLQGRRSGFSFGVVRFLFGVVRHCYFIDYHAQSKNDFGPICAYFCGGQ